MKRLLFLLLLLVACRPAEPPQDPGRVLVPQVEPEQPWTPGGREVVTILCGMQPGTYLGEIDGKVAVWGYLSPGPIQTPLIMRAMYAAADSLCRARTGQRWMVPRPMRAHTVTLQAMTGAAATGRPVVVEIRREP